MELKVHRIINKHCVIDTSMELFNWNESKEANISMSYTLLKQFIIKIIMLSWSKLEKQITHKPTGGHYTNIY